MIDLKLNEIPADPENLSEAERQRRIAETPARGLSINDTIAREANLSVGARGADTSGVAAGAGAGAGGTFLTPDVSGSAMPEIVPSGRGTGTTPLAEAPSGKTSTDRTSFDE